jgi:hypothetical protein
MNSLWDDGQAEIGTYQASHIVYGKPRTFESLYITVKEDFSPRLLVKADQASSANIPVLKLNVISTIPTEYYEYRYLTSVFVKRDNPMDLLKLTNGSQEACGNTFKELKNWESNVKFTFHSYFDREGDGTVNLDLRPGDLLEDQLPVALRSLPFRIGYQLHSRVADSLISNRAKVPQMTNASISVQGEENVGDWKVWRGYCQLVVVGVRLGRFVADLRIHQAHVTSCQTRKERDLKSRWLLVRAVVGGHLSTRKTPEPLISKKLEKL